MESLPTSHPGRSACKASAFAAASAFIRADFDRKSGNLVSFPASFIVVRPRSGDVVIDHHTGVDRRDAIQITTSALRPINSWMRHFECELCVILMEDRGDNRLFRVAVILRICPLQSAFFPRMDCMRFDFSNWPIVVVVNLDRCNAEAKTI